jgi:hypothetical protein
MSLGIANVFGDFLQMPLARTFDLYELWVFLRLLRAAAARHGANGDELEELFQHGPAASPWRPARCAFLSRPPVSPCASSADIGSSGLNTTGGEASAGTCSPTW